MQSYHFDIQANRDRLIPFLLELQVQPDLSRKKIERLIKKHPSASGAIFTKDQLVRAYRELAGTQGLLPLDETVLTQLQMKPMRTMSGVTPVTVLTKPFPCPGTCIFCPNDIRMPKSYLSDEPGAQRAERNYFDPYLQTYNRLQAFQNIGHPVEKIEIIILGGTWSYYPEPYQRWFIKECFRALNEFGHQDDRARVEKTYQDMELAYKAADAHAPSSNPSQNKHVLQSRSIKGEDLQKTYNQVISELYVAPERMAGFDAYQSTSWEELSEQQRLNETANCRNVGLVIETRPDNISEEEVIKIRRLGCTKTQIGFQSLNDDVLSKNKRGHDVAATRRAVGLLRQAGFKIHAHWMANLYGSSVELDKQDYLKLFSDPDFKPDELKIYPCSLIGSAELMQYYKKGLWKPYEYHELLDVLTSCLTHTPEYCRLTRVIRDIPSTDIVEGNKLTNFRQIAEQAMEKAGEHSQDIRAREIRGQQYDIESLQLSEVSYDTTTATEIFLQYVLPVPDKPPRIAAFLRLSLPKQDSFIPELTKTAMIREIHVYGRAVGLRKKAQDATQHGGLGSQLIERAKQIAADHAYQQLAVISAVGTREYYRKRGFRDGELYQLQTL